VVTAADVVVLQFGGRRPPRPLADLPTISITEPADVDTAVAAVRRVVVLGTDADLATVLTRLLRTENLGVEVGFVPGRRGGRRALTGTARRVPLIRDDTGTVVVGSAEWRTADEDVLHGEAVVDDAVLFDGDVPAVRVEPTEAMPGLRASTLTARGRPTRWIAGRAAQLGTPGALVMRDGVMASRQVKRSTFYRHTEGWLRVG
jgi:hypothetical protein